jgi:hypothetical protein
MTCMRNTGIALAILPALMFPACEESLPPHTDPQVVLIPSVTISGSLVRVEEGAVTSGGNIRLSIWNVYDDVLSDTATVRAYVTVTLQENPAYFRLLVLDERDVVNAGFVLGHTLTLEVHDTITVMQPWDHRSESSSPFWTAGMQFRRLVTDKGVVYYESPPVHLIVDANLQIFKRVPAVRLPRQVFTVVYQLWRMDQP